MELSNTQLIAAAVIVVFALIALGMALWIGHRTGNAKGYELGRLTATNYWRSLHDQRRDERNETQRLLDCRNREIQTLRDNIRIEADDNAAVIRELHDRLSSTQPLTEEDRATLHGIAAKLTLAADTFAGMRAHDHARLARAFAAYATEMANRPAPTLHRHPDTELIEWLDEAAATYYVDQGAAEVRFPINPAPEGYDHLRDLLRAAMQQDLDLTQHHQATLEASA